VLAAAEPSKVPFYVAGGVLVVWALVLAAAGLSQPSFPYGARGGRVVMFLSFLLAGFAIAMAVAIDK
jgi:hypothetical protein